MPPEDRDLALLWDMREAARDITEFMQGITFFHFNSNKMLRVLAHEYGEILVERIWLVATERIPELLKLLDPLIPPPPQTESDETLEISL